MYNLSEANGGYLNLSSAIAVAGTNLTFTTTGTGPVAFNGIIKALTTFTNIQGTFLPSGATSTYQGAIPPKNLINNQKCSFVWCVDFALNLYVVQGAIVDSTQPAPIPAPQGAVDPVQSSGAAPTQTANTFLPQFTTGLVPIALFTVKTDSVDGLQLPAAWGAPTAPAISGVTFQTSWGGTGITTTAYQLFNWPSNALV